MTRVFTAIARRSLLWLERLWQDVRHGARVFARNPALTAVAVISIAFGTGANVAIFSVADALLLRPLPVPRPSELVTVGSRVRNGTFYQNRASYQDYLDIRARARSFDGLVAYDYESAGVAARVGETPRGRIVTFVSDNFFRVLGVAPELGRDFLPEEVDTAGGAAVAVLGDSLWRGEFAGDRSVLGRKMRVSGIEVAIVGVAPERFTGLDPYLRDSVFLPLSMLPRVVDRPGPGRWCSACPSRWRVRCWSALDRRSRPRASI